MREHGFDAPADVLKKAAGPGSDVDDLSIEIARDIAKSAGIPDQRTLSRRRIERMFRSEVGLDELRQFFGKLNEEALDEI